MSKLEIFITMMFVFHLLFELAIFGVLTRIEALIIKGGKNNV